MGMWIIEVFNIYGWMIRICGVELGGMVQELLIVIFLIDEGGIDMKCLIEIVISDWCEVELLIVGLMVLVYCKNIDQVIFIGVQMVYCLVSYDKKEVIVNVNLLVWLFYIFVSCCFVYYFKCMVCDWVGGL